MSRHADALRDIARWSRGEANRDDIRNQIWLEATELEERLGRPPALHDADDAAEVLRGVRRHFDRLQRAARGLRSIDQPLGDDAGPCYADLLAGDDGAHPLTLLESLEEPASQPALPAPCHSEVAAWHWLALRFDRRTVDLAAYLLISTSWCYARRRRARRRALAQQPLPQALPLDQREQAAALQPWRKFKLPPRGRGTPDQLTFDYWRRPAQPARGQLWLL